MKKIIRVFMCSILLILISTMNVYAKEEPGEEVKEKVTDINPLKNKKISVSAEAYSYHTIKLKWNSLKDAHGYTIYRSTKKGTKGSELKRIKSGNTEKYYDKTVKIGKTYYYTVRAYTVVDGERIYGEYSKQISQKASLAKARIRSVKRESYQSVSIKWDKVRDASGYRIYRSSSENGEYKGIATITDSSTLKYTCKVPVCGKKYYYKVKAYRKYNGLKYFGVESDSCSGRTTPSETAFTDKCMSRVDSVTLYWKKASGAKGYAIYRSTKKSSGFKCVKTIKSADTLKWTNKLKDEKIYYYKIRPYTIVNDKKVFGNYSKVYMKKDIAKKFDKVKKYTNVKYVSGGQTTRGWDCSGFTKWAINYIYGVEIPKSSGSQAVTGISVNKYDMSKWQPGDILVYSSGGRVNHVALYLGDGEMMHALNTKYDTVIQEVEYYESWDKRNNLCRVRRCF